MPFSQARMFSTANCSASIFLAVPLAELFSFFAIFHHQHNRKGKSIFFFFWQSRVFNCPPPLEFKWTTPCLWKKKFMTSVFSRMLIRICSYYLSQHFLEKYCETSYMRPPKVQEKFLCSWSAMWYKNAKLTQDEQRADIIFVCLLP